MVLLKFELLLLIVLLLLLDLLEEPLFGVFLVDLLEPVEKKYRLLIS